MKLAIESVDDDRVVFVVEDADLALVNALRRVVLAEVPYVALALDGWNFRENTCVLHNHFLGHRITMTPLHLSRTEADAYIPGSIKVSLKVAHSSTARAPLDVTSKDLAVTLHDQPHPDTARLYPADPLTGDHVLLTVLKPGEAVVAESSAVRGVAGTHACFAVASQCAFEPLLDADIVKSRRPTSKDPAVQNRFQHIDRLRCWTAGPDGNPRAFRFTVASECGMTALDIVESALDVLESKCVTSAATVHPGDGGTTTLEVAGEGHTLGNFLQSVAMDDLVGDAPKPLAFAGYHCPHPLEKRVLFTLRTTPGTSPLEAFGAMKAAGAERVRELRHLLREESARVELA